MKNKFETARLPNRKVKGTTTALRPRACALLYLVGVSMFHVFNLTIVGQSGEKVFLKDFLIFNYAYILITYIFDLKVGFL